jgi:hypothetical protein
MARVSVTLASRFRPGLALEPIAIAIGVVAVLLAAITVYVPGRRDQALAQHSVRDAEAIADAAVQFYWRTARWPTSVAELTTRELPAMTASVNRFGYPVTVSGAGRYVTVSTPITGRPPVTGTGVSLTGSGSQTIVTVTRSLTDRGTAETSFAKRHLY